MIYWYPVKFDNYTLCTFRDIERYGDFLKTTLDPLGQNGGSIKYCFRYKNNIVPCSRQNKLLGKYTHDKVEGGGSEGGVDKL